ncbi:MAG: hypothetical protein J6B34_00820 [Clostridia bacterium]|nr:hypothetical protein [Clostridia bacterium]
MRLKISVALLAVLAIMAMLIGCGSTGDTSGNGSNAGGGVRYEKGEQIQLYLEGGEEYLLADFISDKYITATIDDSAVATVKDGKLLPQRQGIATLSCKYADSVVTYEIIVHGGARPDLSWEIDSADSFEGVVGYTYKLLTHFSDMSLVDVEFTAKNGDILGSDIAAYDGKGNVRLVGVGEVEAWIHLKDNDLNGGIKVNLKSNLPDFRISDYILSALGKTELKDGEYITRAQLNEIKTLTIDSLLTVEETELKAILTGLESIKLSLGDNTGNGFCYNISQGSLAYSFVGNEEKVYDISIVSGERSRLDVSLSNVTLKTSQRAILDFSRVGATNLKLEGKCRLEGINCSSVISAKNLNLSIERNSAIEIKGAEGDLSKPDGANGITALGSVTIKSMSVGKDVTLAISGGNGLEGSASHRDAGNGGFGISAQSVRLEGHMTVAIVGGNGGNGANGADGIRGKGYGDGSWWNSSDGGNGGNGENGGNGGKGANGVHTTQLEIVIANVALSGGNSGNGGNGGNGGDGGNGANAGAMGNNNESGYGGNGGNGGNGGKAYTGAKSTNVSRIIATQGAKCDMSNGTDGIGGYSGEGGAGGKPGNDTPFLVPIGKTGKNGSSGSEGYTEANDNNN